MNNKNILVLIAISIILCLSLVNATYDDEDLRDGLLTLEDNGVLSPELIKNLENLSPEQKSQIISNINSDTKEFWNQWKKDLTTDQKRALLEGLSEQDKNSFMQNYGKHYNVDFKNMGNEAVLFGDKNVIGNSKGFFQMDKVVEFNKKNPNNKITSIEYKKEGSTSSLVFKKQNGNTLDLTVDQSQKGFYFNPDSGQIGRVGENGLVDQKDPFSGKWNGLGSLKIDASTNEVKLSFEYGKNKDGIANDNTNFAEFTNSKKESYSVFRHPNGEYDNKGNLLYALKDGELTFDSKGKLTKINNMYKNKEGSKYFFGKDFTVTYDSESYDKAKGSKIMIDLETNLITKADVERVSGGALGDTKTKFNEINSYMGKLNEKISGISGKIQLAKSSLTTARNAVATAERLGFGIDLAKSALETIEGKIKSEFASELGLPQEHPLIKSLTSEGGLFVIDKVLRHANIGVGATGDLANTFSNTVDSISKNLNNPLLSSLNQHPEAILYIQLNNQDAKKLKNIEMYGGSLQITDSYGKLVNIAQANSYGYVLPAKINNKETSFQDINFNLLNKNFNEMQAINIFSDQYGNLNVVGVNMNSNGKWIRGLTDLQSVKGEYKVDAGGGVSYGYRFLFWGDSGYKGSYENVLTADYKVDSNSIALAKAYEAQANEEYRKLYYQYQQDGWSDKERKELTQLRDSLYVKYNQVLNSGNIDLSVTSSRLSSSLSSFSGGQTQFNNDIIRQITTDTVLNNKNLQGQLAEQGIGLSDVSSFVKQELSNIGSFIKANPSNYLQFTKDASNNVYQIRAGGNTYNINPIAGPLIGNVLPVIAGSGGIDNNGNFYINPRDTRFGRSIGINVYGGYYQGISQSLYAKRNADAIKYGIESTVKTLVKQKISNPSSPSGYQVYSPNYYMH
ncbi:MAG: hypothetical protein ABIH37_02970 [archaeon]